MKTNSEYRAVAREKLEGRWNEAAVLGAIIMGLTVLVNIVPDVMLRNSFDALALTVNAFTLVITLLFIAPLEYAMYNTFLSVLRDEEDGPWPEMMWRFFKGDYDRYVVAMILETLVIFGIGIITFGIGAIIFSYAYKMVPFLLRDYPELSPKEALKLSREVMRGSKWDLFVLELTFLGWILLGILSCGILLCWIIPYMSTAEAEFYNDLKNEAIVEEEA